MPRRVHLVERGSEARLDVRVGLADALSDQAVSRATGHLRRQSIDERIDMVGTERHGDHERRVLVDRCGIAGGDLELRSKPPAWRAAPVGSPTPAADMTAAIRPARFGTSNLRMRRRELRGDRAKRHALSRRDLLVRVTTRDHVDDLACLAVRTIVGGAIRSETYIYRATNAAL